jgi:hypothetical protein
MAEKHIALLTFVIVLVVLFLLGQTCGNPWLSTSR